MSPAGGACSRADYAKTSLEKRKQPKLSDRQRKELRRMHDSGDYSISDLAELS